MVTIAHALAVKIDFRVAYSHLPQAIAVSANASCESCRWIPHSILLTYKSNELTYSPSGDTSSRPIRAVGNKCSR